MLSLRIMDSIAVFTFLFIILSRLVRSDTWPSHNVLLNRSVAFVALRFSRNRAARIRRFARWQLKLSEVHSFNNRLQFPYIDKVRMCYKPKCS